VPTTYLNFLKNKINKGPKKTTKALKMKYRDEIILKAITKYD
jgi:hypothetical protein